MRSWRIDPGINYVKLILSGRESRVARTTPTGVSAFGTL